MSKYDDWKTTEPEMDNTAWYDAREQYFASLDALASQQCSACGHDRSSHEMLPVTGLTTGQPRSEETPVCLACETVCEFQEDR